LAIGARLSAADLAALSARTARLARRLLILLLLLLLLPFPAAATRTRIPLWHSLGDRFAMEIPAEALVIVAASVYTCSAAGLFSLHCRLHCQRSLAGAARLSAF
jgi:hypothetical protein